MGAELNWKCKGYILTDEQKTTLKAEALEHQQTRQRELETKQKSTALRLERKLSMMTEVVEPTPYMQAKGIQVHSGVYTDEEKKLTCIPATDCEGNLWTVQYISEDGTKRFAKDSKKRAAFMFWAV